MANHRVDAKYSSGFLAFGHKYSNTCLAHIIAKVAQERLCIRYAERETRTAMAPWTPPLLTFPVHCFMQVMGSFKWSDSSPADNFRQRFQVNSQKSLRQNPCGASSHQRHRTCLFCSQDEAILSSAGGFSSCRMLHRTSKNMEKT